MKKIFFAMAFLFATTSIKAQGFYLDASAGYGFSPKNNTLGYSNDIMINNGVQSVNTTKIKGTLGKGFNVQLTPGYMFLDYLGFEIGINYFGSANILMGKSQKTLNSPAQGFNNEDFGHVDTTAKAQMFRIIPAIVVSTGLSKKYSGYLKLGLVLPLWGVTHAQINEEKGTVQSGQINFTKTETRANVSGNVSFGFQGALGFNYNISKGFSVFAEFFYSALHINKKEQIATSVKVNGVENIDNIPTFQKETVYVKDYDPNFNKDQFGLPADVTIPNRQPASKADFSSLGVQIGVKYCFPTKKSKAAPTE